MRTEYLRKFERLIALCVRDQKTRFAGGALGYLWAYFNPIFWIAFVVVFFNVVGRLPPINVGAEIFVATGILPYAMFRQVNSSQIRTVSANRYMRYLRPVSDIELMEASALLELLNVALTSLIIFGGIIFIFDAPLPAYLRVVYIAMGTAWFLGVGVGSLFSVLSKMSDSFARAVPILLRPMFWVSGIFYTATELSADLQAIFWWNPLFHSIELLREGFFLGYASPIANAWYPIYFGAICMLIAVFIEFRAQTEKRGRHRI